MGWFLMSAATPAEWAAAGSLGLSAISLIRLALAFADADGGYFDPRPAAYRARLAVWEAVRSESLYLLRLRWDNARHSARNAALDAAALVLLLTTSPKGALR